MSLSKAEICALLPHAGDMCLLDTVLIWDMNEITARASSHRDPNNPLRSDGMLPAVCGVEYAAQVVGIHGGLVLRESRAKPTAGYLAALRDLTLTVVRLDDIEDDLIIHARRLVADADSAVCEFNVTGAGRALLSGRATLVLNPRLR